MRAVTPRAAPPDPAPYAAAEAAFAEAKAYLSSREAQQMSESDLERELQRRGQELMRKLLQGHLDQRSPGEAAGPVAGADGVERSQRRVHQRCIETTFGTVAVERVGYARPGHDSLHPLDAALNLPPERYSLEVRRRVAEAAASRSFDEALFDLSRSTGAEVPKRQAEQLVARAAEDFDAFYEARRAAEGEPSPEGAVVVLTFDGKGVGAASRRPARGDAAGGREAPAATGAALPVQAPEAGREEACEAHGDGGRRLHDGAVRAQPRAVPAKPDATTAGREAPARAAPPGGQAGLGEPRTRALGGGRRGDAGSRASGPRARQALGRARRWRRGRSLDLVEAGAAAYGVDVTVILDIIHVVEYVWKAAHAFHREGSPDAAHWAWTRVQSILEGKSSKVAAAMRRAATVAGLSSDTRKPVDTCADYLQKYAPYLHYDRYLAAGYPIATGVIEGACRYLVRDRMELTGARWRLVGAEAVLKLRALRASGDFDAYWDFHEAREYERNHAQRYAERTVPPVSEPPPPPSPPRLRRVK